MKKIIYLAGPYSHENKEIEKERYKKLCALANKLISEDVCVVAPVIFGHPLVEATGVKSDWGTWERYCSALLKLSTEMLVLKQPGWEESAGVRGEMELALELGISIRFHEPI